MKLTFNAALLRIILIIGMLLLVTGAAAGFILAEKKLQEFATSINQLEADAAAGDGNITALQKLEETLKTTQDIKTKADSVAVPASDYPVAVIQNITGIANRAGIKLSAVSYGGSETSATPQTNPGSTPAAPGLATPATPTPGVTLPSSGATKKTVNVTTESPVSYDALMSFLQGIETDDIYMHVTKVSISKAEGNQVNTQPFIIEVYVQ